MINKLTTQISIQLTPQHLTLIRLVLVGLTLLATAFYPHSVWADISGGGRGGS